MSVPYTVQSGETFQDIATKLGIKDWTKLKEYHTQQTGQQVPSIPYAGLTLMTPTQEEIYEMNGETPPPDPAEEQKNAEQKQGEEKKKEEDKKKEEKASKSEHDGKYFVVHNAKCICDKAENPKQTADLQVTTHKIIVLNDDQSKLAATEADKTFIPPVATFGKCTLKPTAGGYLPCALAPGKWSKTYESTQVMGKNTLTEISELQCTVGGKITIDKHGQTDSVSNAHADNTNPLELSMVNPAIEQPKKKEEYPVVTSISMTGIENRENFKEIDSKNKKEITYLRKDEEVSFKANLKSGNKQLTSWMVYSDHQGKKENRLFLREQIGTEFSQSFANTGTFRIEGYGKPKDPDFEKGKYDKCDPSCSLDVEVVENTLQDIECTSGDFSTRIDPSKNRKFRRGVPSVFKAKFFIPNLTEDEKSRLTMTLTDGDGNVLTEAVQTGETLTFTPKNTKAKYTVIARYTNDNGDIIEKKISGESEGNAVLGISHGAEAIRPGTPMSFSVSKMKYNIGTNNPYDVTPDESSEIKWNLNGISKGNGKSITLPGTEFTNPGKYIVEAYSNVANAHGKSSKDEEDDWRFEVKYNTVTEIKAGKKARTGSEVPFEIGKTALNGYDATKDGPITWKITGPASGTGTGEKFNYKFLLPGEYTIDCLMGGRSSQNPLKIKVVQPKILVDTSKWIDNDGNSGNVIKEAGYGQEVCAFVKYEGIQGEEVTLQIYDNDSNGINLVHNITGTLPENTGGVYWPFTLDNSIKLKIEAKGLTKDGKLHFKLVPKDAALKIVNGEKSLGEYLKVSNVPKIVDAYFCDAADTEKLYNSPIDKALYLKVYAINMVDKKVEVHFMTKSDIYFDVAWNPKQWKDWKGVKEKFSKETFFYKTDGTINKKGELIVKVDPSKLGKPKNYFKISAVIKITEGEGKDAKEKAAYLDHSEMAILYATATLPNMAENKGAVKVGREQLNGGDNTTCICKETSLIWGGHKNVNCEFRKKVIDISKRQDFDPNDLMAVMQVETSGTFSASKIELKDTKEKRKNGTFKKEYRGLTKDEILQLSEDFTGAVGLIQFTPIAISSLNTNYNLTLTKRKLALMSQLEQLDYVEKYIALWKKTKNITGKISLSDLYVLVFAPNYFGTSDNTTLYKEGSDYYNANASVDTDGKNGITKNEIAARAIAAKSEGVAYKTTKFSCGNGNNSNNISSKDVVTFRIYANGKIEKCIPKAIKEEYKQKYKYVFHDKEGKEHNICVVDWHTTSKKLPSRSKLDKKPTHSKVISDNIVSEGQTQRRVIYENGDIAEYGSNRGDTFWRLYSATAETIELIKMPDTTDYVQYSFSGTKRTYTGPNYFAGFIGALAITGLSVTTTGSCFREGSCFPSQFHVNGESVDTMYFWKLETDQKFVDAMKFFHFDERKVGNNPYFKKLKDVSDGGDLHDSHLHCGEFDNSQIIEIKEK